MQNENLCIESILKSQDTRAISAGIFNPGPLTSISTCTSIIAAVVAAKTAETRNGIPLRFDRNNQILHYTSFCVDARKAFAVVRHPTRTIARPIVSRRTPHKVWAYMMSPLMPEREKIA